MALSEKQLTFIDEYMIDKNASRAARVAGYGKTDKSSSTLGYRLLENVEVRAEIEKRRALEEKDAKRRAINAGITKERWLEELRLIAFANMDNYINIEREVRKNGYQGKDYTVTMVIPKATKDRARHLGRVIKKITESKNGVSIELHSKQAALETIGRHFGWVKNEAVVEVGDSVKVNLTMPKNGYEANENPVDETDVKHEVAGDVDN